MKTMPILKQTESFPATLMKFISVMLLGGTVGLVSAAYSPLLTLTGVAAFTGFTLAIYIGSQGRFMRHSLLETEDLLFEISQKNGVLFYLFYLSFFLSITIPKAGKTMAGIPITASNLFILLTLICWLATLLFSRRSLFELPLGKSLAFLIVYGGISILIGIINQNNRKAMVLDFVAFIGFISVYFLVISLVRTEKQIHLLIGAVLCSLLLVCGYGMLQQILGFERVNIPGITEQYGKIMYQGVGRWNVIEGGSEKVYSTYQNGNIFGNHLATFIPFVGGILIGLPRSKKKLMGIGIFLLAGYVLILTYSRGALAGTASGILALAVISKKIRLRALLVIVLIAVVFLVFLYRYSDRPELTRYNLRRLISEPDRFSAGRLERAKETLRGFARLPFFSQLFGLGFGGILVSPRGWRFEYVDNLYLTLLFKMGVIGLGFLVVALLQLFSMLFRLRDQIPTLYFQGLINGGIAGLFASLTHNLADTLWFFPPLSANFWFLAGITMTIALIGSRKSAIRQETLIPPQVNRIRAASHASKTTRAQPSPTI